MSKKRIVLLGGSGSVGSQTLDVLLQHTELFEIVGLSVGNNTQFLSDYLQRHSLAYASVSSESSAHQFEQLYPNTKFYYGDQGLQFLASLDEYDILFNCLQGFVGLLPTLKAIEKGHDVACANKESLVAAGDIVMSEAKKNNVTIIPVDSEHSAIFQTLEGYQKSDINKLIITASGGSFLNRSRDQLKDVTIDQALNHPKWHMGHKITIDSATMMNKGFEVIEAHILFDIPYQNIDVLLHPQSIIHSMTEFKDHSVLAQLANADMRLPIQYALTYPERVDNSSTALDLAMIGSLTFKHMDYERFPLLDLAYAVGYIGGNLPAILNGANEQAVDLFLDGKIKFLDIESLIISTIKLAKDYYNPTPKLEDIIEANQWAIDTVNSLVKEL